MSYSFNRPKIPVLKDGEPNVWLLRWRFDFADSKPTRYGEWNRSSNNPANMACFVNKENLLRATVEAKHYVKRGEPSAIAECDGHEFVNFKWIAERNAKVNNTRLVGMTMVCRDVEIDCYIDGSLQVRQRDEEDKKFHYEGFGK